MEGGFIKRRKLISREIPSKLASILHSALSGLRRYSVLGLVVESGGHSGTAKRQRDFSEESRLRLKGSVELSSVDFFYGPESILFAYKPFASLHFA